MVKTLLKTSLREIRQSLGRYLAILAIVGLGVGFFAGLRTCQPSMAATGVEYLAGQRMFDFRLLSTLGFTEEDVAYFSGLEGVAAARGAVYTDFLAETGGNNEEQVIKAHSLTEGINLPQLQAGRMPEAPNECLGDARYFTEEDLRGSLRVSASNTEDTHELLHCGEYTIVGLALSPCYLNYERGTSSIGSGSVSAFVYIPEDGFDFEAYYEIYLVLEDPADAYSDAYAGQIDAIKPEIERAVEARADLRYTTIYEDAMSEIRDAEEEISDGWDEYRSERADAERELDDAHTELTDGEQEYADGVKDYEQGRRNYASGMRDYKDGQQKAADAEQEIADAEKELADAEKELADAEQELADARQELNDGWAEYEQGKADAAQELADAHQKLADGEREYEDGKKEYADGLEQLADAEDALIEAEQKIRDGEVELADGERELADAWAQIEDARRELSAAEAQLDDAKKQLDEAEAQMPDAKKKLDEAEAQLTDAKKQLDEGEASYGQLQQLYTSTEQLAQGVGAAMGVSLDAGTLIQMLASGTMPELNGAVDQALQGSGSSAAELAAHWQAAESQLGAPLTSGTIAGLRATLDQSTAEYEAGLAEYNAGKAEYEEGLAKYNTGKAEYETGLAQYNSGRAEYQDGLSEYRDGEAQIESARKELQDGKTELEEGRRELDDARTELDEAKQKLDDARQELDDGWREYFDGAAEAEEELDKAYRELTDGEHEYADGLQKYEDGLRDYRDGQKELEDGRQELADAWKELEDARRKLEDAKDELARAPGELADARQELDDGWQEYNDGRAEADQEFADAEAELTDAEKKLADAYDDLRDLKHATTYTLTRNENVGYACFENDTSIIAAISVVFPVFFFLVAALVCMTTMTRMVDEQRTQIGVLKALGYSNSQIMGKYLFYSGSAALTGSTVGFALGAYSLPWIFWEIYAIIYGFAPLKFVIPRELIAVSFAAALLCSMGATYLSCRMELARQAAELLRPKTPRAGRRVFLEYITPLWRRLGFLYKVSVRNVLRYQSRLIMMVLGIGGCTALLVTGFGIRDSIQHVADNQFDEIQTYDYAVTFQDPQTEQSAADYLTKYGWAPEDGKLVHSGSIEVLTGEGSKSVFLVIPASGSLERFVSLHSGETPLPYPGSGEVAVNVGLAENMGISVGDAIQLRDEEYGTLYVTVSGIFDNYVQNYVYLSLDTYREQYDEQPEYNTLYVLGHEGADRYEEGALLLEDDGVGNVTVNQATRDQVDSMLSRLDYIVVVVVACAGALAFIVLYNLTNINITERVREIATIKVLGFYRNEVASYVFREINILSVLGSLAGLLMGKALHAFVISQIQIDAMFFASRIAPLSYILSLCVTMLFTFGISLGMRPKLHKIDMAESLKSIE